MYSSVSETPGARAEVGVEAHLARVRGLVALCRVQSLELLERARDTVDTGLHFQGLVRATPRQEGQRAQRVPAPKIP